MKKFIGVLICVWLSAFTAWADGRLDSLLQSFSGNWMNVETGEWEYGFYEDFAVWQSDFWSYEKIEKRGRKVDMVLRKEEQTVRLTLHQKPARPLVITDGKGKKQEYFLRPKGFIPYRDADTLSFAEPTLLPDSVLIIGYYRHLDKVKPEFKERWGKYEVEVGYEDLLRLEQHLVKTKIDSMGRFRVKIPVYAPQRIFLDWGKLWKSMVVIPGETLLICLDMQEFQPQGEEKDNRQAYWNRSKDILFMGKYARLHSEMAYCPNAFAMRDMYELKKLAGSDMEFLHLAEADYLNYLKVFTEFHRQYPTLSQRCIQAVTNEAKYEFGHTLMQNRFNARKKKAFGFDDPAYMEYVNQHFSVDSVLYYFLLSHYEGFVRDYTGYYDDLTYRYVEGVGMCKTNPDQYTNALKRLEVQGDLKGIEKEELKAYITLIDRLFQGKQEAVYVSFLGRTQDSCLLAKYDYLRQEPVVKDMMDRLGTEEKLLLYDTLISNRPLREIFTAIHFAKDMQHDHVPLSSELLDLLEEKITSSVLRNPVLEIDKHYRQLAQKSIQYPQSLINTDHLNRIKDPDSLWTALLAPYRGKVILLDFWGTWCKPCKQMLERLAPLKHDFENQDVIFMYFAYASPEVSWKNIIKEFDLSGKQIVHYNLAPEQQKMVLKLQKVNIFPTYMLIDRNGEIRTARIPYPIEKRKLKEAIRKLLVN